MSANKIQAKFRELKKSKKKAFISYITAGDPTIDITKKLVFALEKAGVDLIEIGIPFSDPLADGPTIQRASERSLKNNTCLSQILALVKKNKNRIKSPVILMGYYNPIFRYGVAKFIKDAAIAGVSGIIVPDLPPDEADEIIKEGRRRNIYVIFLLAPTSTDKRIKLVAEKSTGFIYYVSLTGTTGERKAISSGLSKNISRIRKATTKPVCVGFGISTAKQVKDICKTADGVIVGSAIIKIVENNLDDRKKIVNSVYRFVRKLVIAAKG